MTDINSQPNNTPTPFAGRKVAYTRLQQHILDPVDTHAIIFTGHQGMGKSALLRHAHEIFDDPILPVYTPLSGKIDKTHLLQNIIDGINQLLELHQFSLSRVPNLEPDSDLARDEWFRDIYLPQIVSIIRPHRRIVWLLDDAQHLLDIDVDLPDYLHSLIKSQPQFRIVCTLSTEYENELLKLQPLIDPVKAERIHRLNAEDSAELIRQYASGASDEMVNEIFSATGGHPQLLAYYGETLRQYRVDHSDSSAYAQTKPDVYRKSQADFRHIWQKLSRDERLVLTAIASLIYDDPLQIVTPKRIEQWLIETDYLLDIVTINAALRGLDYQDIVNQQQNEGVRLTMGLMQQWLLEQARLDDTEQVTRGQLPTWVIILGIVLILVIVVLLMTIPPQYLDNNSVLPTATLVS